MGFFTEKQLSLNPETELFSDLITEIANDTGANFDQFVPAIHAITKHDAVFLSTPEGFNQFRGFIAVMAQLGRDEKHYTLEDKKLELEELQDDGAKSIRAVADKHGREAKNSSLLSVIFCEKRPIRKNLRITN